MNVVIVLFARFADKHCTAPASVRRYMLLGSPQSSQIAHVSHAFHRVTTPRLLAAILLPLQSSVAHKSELLT